MRVPVLLALALAAAPALPSAAAGPNVVLIFADDLGISDLGCYGRGEHATPNLDRLAGDGLRFTSATCAQPICSPSRAALLTGKAPARLHLTNFLPGRADAPSQKLLHPVIEGQLPLVEMTLAEVLRDAGYATACIGKWHLGGKGFGPAEQGFGTVFDGKGNTPPSATEGGKGEMALTAAAEAFLDTNRDKPFFLYLAHHTPHIPLGAKPELVEKNTSAFHPTYAAMMETMDESVGRVMKKIEDLGLRERTVFIFASDNGGLHVLEFPGTPATRNAPFRAGKGHLYEGGLRIPLIVRWPGTVKPGVVDTPVILTDLMPTLMELAGIEPGKSTGPLDGISHAKALRGGAFTARPLFWHFPHYTNQGGRPGGAMRDGDWKLVEPYEDGGLELYNLKDDVGETRNLAVTEAQRAREMRAKLEAWRQSMGAQEMRPNPNFDAALHRRLYVDQDCSTLKPSTTAAATEPSWKDWRQAMNQAVKGDKVTVVRPEDQILLPCSAAQTHGEKIRYEPQTFKNTVGFWVNPADWVSWDVEVATAGKYRLEILQGCGKGSGGAQVDIAVGGQTLPYTVRETGHFQNFILRDVGVVTLPVGKHTLSIKPKTKPGGAVMDVRQMRLIRE